MYYIIRILILIMVVLGVLYFKNLNVEDIIHYTPENRFFASITILFLYALKSITLVIPLIILYISASILLSTPGALLINLIGLIICMSLPYFIGRFSGKEFINKIISK